MASRVIGGALWGRLTGLVTGVINSLVEWFTGKDIGDHIYAKIWGEPANSNAAALAAKPVGEKDAVMEVDPAQVAVATVPELVLAPDDLPTSEIIQLNLKSDAATTAIPKMEWPEFPPRHFHHLPYRLNGNLGEPQHGIGKLNIDA